MEIINKPKVLFILGPTGSGKSEIAIKLALKYNGEIISADSVQIYKEFDIGSAKVTKSEMQGITHYGISLKPPTEEFSVYDYVQYTIEKIEDITKRKKLPIIVGGTGLYVKALIEGYNFGNTEKHHDFRIELEEEIKEHGLDYVYQKLYIKDSKLAESIDRNNPVRVIRAFEIANFGSSKAKTNNCQYDFKLIAITLDREILYNKINLRVDKMLENGLIEEVSSLYKKYGGNIQPMKAIGYKEVLPYLNGEVEKSSMIELIKQHTRNYAKRQLTFLHGINNVIYIDNKNKDKAFKDACKEIEKWLKIQK